MFFSYGFPAEGGKSTRYSQTTREVFYLTGTWFNFGGVILGALIGLAVGRGIPKRISDAVMQIEGLGIAIIAMNGVIAAMFTANPETGKLTDSGGLLLLVSLVVGCAAGELIRIDDHMNRLGAAVETRFKAKGFAKGFVTASLIFCVGAMSIIGPLNDGLRGDSSVLFMKTALDFTTAIILASVLGYGVVFSAVPVLLFQGSVALLSGWISPLISEGLLAMICMVGYSIVLVIGINFLFSTKIKTANLLPALLIPIIYELIRTFWM
jgi:uncharacterized membrane protein YqgA involved in biofilm formation